MPFHLLLPGLAWPGAATARPSRDLALPSLSALLGHASVKISPPRPLDGWLADAFQLKGEPPLGALRRTGEALEMDPSQAAGPWLCADPVHLHFAREHLLLADAGDLAITREEAGRLVEGLNETFADIGHFESATPERWYLRPLEAPKARFAPLADVVSRPVAMFLPEGEDGRYWQRTINELQVWLHNHPVNQAREATGQRAINSLWLWGPGSLPARLPAPAATVMADSPLARGLAKVAGLTPQAVLPPAKPDDDTLALVESLYRPALYMDLDQWREALVQLESDWFAPLLAALKSRRLQRLCITVPGDRALLTLEVAARDLWKFWRKPRPLDDLLTTLP